MDLRSMCGQQSGREEWITLIEVGNKHKLCVWNVEEVWGCLGVNRTCQKLRYKKG